MKKSVNVFFLSLILVSCYAQTPDPTVTEVWEPVPVKVTPGENGAPPSDAIVLFDGNGVNSFRNAEGGPADWIVKDGTLTVHTTGGKYIQTALRFGSCQLHLEFRIPIEEGKDGQEKGNSGLFLMGLYEIQILDSYENKTYSNGQAASVYKQHIPLVNATKPAGEWQVYDIIFTAPTFGDAGHVLHPARVTMIHNGVLVQNNVTIWGPTTYRGLPRYAPHADKLPLQLQNHSNEVSFRNIWLREL